MKPSGFHRLAALAAASLVVAADPCALPAAVSYTATDVTDVIPRLPGTIDSIVINDAGDLAGSYRNPDSPNQIGYWRYYGGQFQDFGYNFGGQLPGDGGGVKGLANDGRMAIHHLPASYSYTDADGLVDLGSLGLDTEANALNNHGQIVGSGIRVAPGDTGERGVVWTEAAGLGPLAGFGGLPTFARALAVADNGWIVGFGEKRGVTFDVPILWIPGEPAQRLGESAGLELFGRANGVNNLGGIIGESGDEVFFLQGTDFVTGFGHIIKEFNGFDIDFTDRVLAGGINDANQVVGTAWVVPNGLGVNSGGWLWTADGGTFFLDDLIDPSLGYDLIAGLDINEQGQILARGSLAGDPVLGGRFFLLTPIPEPSVPLLLACVLGSFLLRRRR